jgi:hypothetical protein
MSSEESEIINALRHYAKVQEAEAAERAPLSPNSTRDLMARIRREEARQGAMESGWLVLLRSRTALAVTAGLAVVVISLVVPLNSTTAQFAMVSPEGIKGETPKPPDFFLDTAPKIAVDWKHQTLRIPLKTGGKLSGTITPKPGVPGAAAREFEIAATGESNGESITATGKMVAMPNNPDDAPQFLRAKDVYWLKLNLALRGNTREEKVYRVFGSP